MEEMRTERLHCLSHCSTAVKRHHGHDNSYKGKLLIEAGLQFRGLILYHHGGWHVGRHGAGEGTEGSIS